MFRKIIVVFLALALICAVSACGTQDKAPEGGSAEPLAGGWELYANGAAALPEDVQAAFEKAAETYTEGNLVPVAYVASQVVAGTNYMILCQEASDADAPAGAYQMVIVYSGFDGSAEIINSASFDLTAYTGGEDTEITHKFFMSLVPEIRNFERKFKFSFHNCKHFVIITICLYH